MGISRLPRRNHMQVRSLKSRNWSDARIASYLGMAEEAVRDALAGRDSFSDGDPGGYASSAGGSWQASSDTYTDPNRGFTAW